MNRDEFAAPAAKAPRLESTADEPLLRIDFAAALGKIAQAQLQGTWQLPTEAVRLMIAAGARSVRVEIAASHWSVHAPGASLSRQVTADFASVLDAELENAERHRAMVDLEARDAFVLAAIACLGVESILLQIGGGTGTSVEQTADGSLRVERPQSSNDVDVELRVRGPRIDAERAAEWLRRSARFAPVEILLAAQPIGRGFPAPLAVGEARIAPKPGSAAALAANSGAALLPAALAIPSQGKSPRLWLLRHGVISSRATVPRYPCFEAAVEMGPASEPQASGAALREKLAAYVDPLIDEMTSLLMRQAEKIARNYEEPEARRSGWEDRRSRLARLLLECLNLDRRAEEIAGLRLFPCWAGLSGTPTRRLLSLHEIRRLMRLDSFDAAAPDALADGDLVALDALTPEDDARRFVLEGRVVLVLSEEERALLAGVLGVVFGTPPPRPSTGLLRRMRLSWHRRRSAATGRAGAPVEEAALEPNERELIARVRAALGSADKAPPILMSDGDGRPHRRVDDVLILPRRNPDVRDCVRLVARDPVWIYPALLLLLGGDEMPPPETRQAWTERRTGEA